MKKYVVTLTPAECEQLNQMIAKGKAAARKLTRARILLKADSAPGRPAWTDVQISQALEVDPKTVANTRQTFVEGGFELALHGHSTRNRRQRRVDGECEARLIAALCGPAPEGYARWSLRLLADQAVELGIVDAPISYETLRQTLQANELKPWLRQEWCIPPEASGEFVCAMEDVLEVYRRPLDPRRPLVCLDELPVQLVSETRAPQPLRRGQPRRYDYEYKREGVANVFLLFAPLLGRRWTRVTPRRTRQEWADVIRQLVDECFPDAERIVLVMDNLNTHVGGALYERFPPAQARRLLDKLEIHYTPKHGSWLNMAEIELSVLSRQCLAQRIPTVSRLTRQIAAWTQTRNASATTVDWQFTTQDARIKLKRLYPVPAGAGLPSPAGAPPETAAAAPAQPKPKARRKAPPPAKPVPKPSTRTRKRAVVHA
jgi:hypothetical protein